ncbi:hypothetical protein HB777_23355 [Mesorhizobium loti]|nr:hypothetical protein HB777_23355 [Mesorhizobium loti]
MSQLEFHAASSADVIFGTDAVGTLRLDDSFDFSGSIAGITNDDKVDLEIFGSAPDIGAYDADSFTVADDGTGRNPADDLHFV